MNKVFIVNFTISVTLNYKHKKKLNALFSFNNL